MKSLTDVVSGAGLSVYAEVALVIFLIAFLGIVISLFAPGKQRAYEHLRRLPIDGDRDTDRSIGTIAIPRFARDDEQGIPRFAPDDNHPVPRLSARDDTTARDDKHA